MDLPIQFAAGAGVAAGAILLAHFFYTMVYAPENMNLGMASNRRHTAGSRAYLAAVALSWAAFAFSGAYGLLAWLPGGGAIAGAVVVAFLSLALLTHIEQSAYATHALRRSTVIQQQLEKLIKYATIPNAGTIAQHKEQAKTAQTLAEREAHEELARLAALLADRDTRLCESAVDQARREAVERVQQQQKVQNIVDAGAARQARHKQFKQVLQGASSALGTTMTLDTLEPDVSALLEPGRANKKWKLLCDFGGRLRQLGPDKPIGPLLQAIAGVRAKEGTAFVLRLNGDERDGYYDAHSLVSGTGSALADGLEFEESLDGLLAAFFLRVALQGHLAWGHGMYGHDQQVVMNLDQAVSILDGSRVNPENPELLNIGVPFGMRVKRAADTLTLNCLTYWPSRGFFDTEVSIASGRASAAKDSKMFDWGERVLY